MADSKPRFVKENVFHCGVCRKPQKNLSVHLARACMKASTPEERKVALAGMKLSGRRWVNVGRNWDYKFLETLIPDETSRLALLGEFSERGFYVDNVPPEATSPAAAEQPSTGTSSPAPSRPRHSRYLHGTRGVIECQRVLEVARPDFLKVVRKCRASTQLTDKEKTKYRYYCEAVLVFRLFQSPAAVDGLTEYAA